MAELRSADGQLSNRLRLDPLRHLRALEIACHEIALKDNHEYAKECGKNRQHINTESRFSFNSSHFPKYLLFPNLTRQDLLRLQSQVRWGRNR